MKDLKFSGKMRAQNSAEQNNFICGITFRTDLISYDHTVGTNFTVLSIILDNAALSNEHEEFFGANFQQLPYNVKSFIDFATTWALTLTIKDSNGSNKETLYDGDQSGSSSL